MIVKAAVTREKGRPFTVEQLELDDPRADEILVRIVGVGLCHSDIVIRNNPVVLPVVLGHEGSGIVEKVGERVTKVKPGDRVVLTFPSCGQCANCLQGHPAYCSNALGLMFGGRRADGSTTLKNQGEKVYGSFFGQSSFATMAIAKERNTVKVSGDAPLEMLGPVGCGIQTGAGAVMNGLRPRAGSSIVVYGLGAVGLSAVMAAAVEGCSKIIGVDVVPSRLQLAKEVGATHVVNATEGDPIQAVKTITGLGADYALECTGVPKVCRQAVESMHRRGVCGVLGFVPGGTEVTFDVNSIMNGRTIVGMVEGDSNPDLFIPQLIDLFVQGKFPLAKLVKVYTLDQINQAVEDSEKGSVVKAILKMPV